jgi:uncharacterized protein YbjT (DUF2867 family)
MSETADRPVTGTTVVTGGTGTLGRLVVAKLREAGRPVRVLSRHAPERASEGVEHLPADLVTGDGVDAAVAGAPVIVHCAGNARDDEAMTRTLVQAVGRSGGTPHLVHVSVVGADRVPIRGRMDRMAFGYFGAKNAAEKVVTESGLPYSILRATQFHDLAFTVVRSLAKLPVVISFSGVRFQPVEAAEVADRLVELAADSPVGLAPELGGPQILPMQDVIRSYLRATGRRRPMLQMRLPGAAFRAVRSGALLCPDHAVGRRTWEEFLAEHVH